MKIIFNDATDLQVQSVYVDASGALRIKTISATQEQLREFFSDQMKTKKITVEERGQTIAVYENYTTYEGTMVYAAGILEVCLYKAGETLMEMLQKVKEENADLQKQCNILAEQNEMLQECILEMSETVYQ